jgi:hypothetical protein
MVKLSKVNAKGAGMKQFMFGLVAIFTMGAVQATELQFVETDQSFETKVCVATAKGDVKGLQALLRQHQERLESVRNAVKCNKVSYMEFAEQYASGRMARYIGVKQNEEAIASLDY